MQKKSIKEIVEVIQAAGYTQTQIAEVTGIHQTTISRIAKGQDPRYSTVLPLLELYEKLGK